MILFILSGVLFTKLDLVSSNCTDIYGRTVVPGIHFIPGPDICQLCVCDVTTAKWCKRVLCSPPQNCTSFVMGASCCDYTCLDNTTPASRDLRDEIDRRFLITLATAFVIIIVLLFIIYKQCRRTREDNVLKQSWLKKLVSSQEMNHNHPSMYCPKYVQTYANYFSKGDALRPDDIKKANIVLDMPEVINNSSTKK